MNRFLLCLAASLMLPAASMAQDATSVDTAPTPPAAHNNNLVLDVRPALLAARKAAAEGDFEQAERLYSILVKHVPQMTEIRMEYAAAARRAGQTARAREILVPVDVDALPPGLRSAYRNIAWGERAFDISFSPRVMFDSNINSGPSSDSITIGGLAFSLDEESRPADSIGAGATLAMQGLWMPTAQTGLGATVIADGDFYESSRFNDINLSVSAGPRFIVGKSLLRFNALAGTRYLGGDNLEDHVGGQAALTFNVAAGTPLTFSTSLRAYEGEGSSGVSRDRDISTYAASISSDQLLPWDGAVWINAAFEQEDWERNLEDNNAYRAGFGLSLPQNDYVETQLMFNATRRLYDNVIPLLGESRAEWRLEPSARLDLKVLETPLGYPYMQYTYIDNRSNISLTNYDQHKFTVGMTIKAW